MINYSIWCFWSLFDFFNSNVPLNKCHRQVACATFYTHQTSGVCAGMCICDRTHQIEKAEQYHEYDLSS